MGHLMVTSRGEPKKFFRRASVDEKFFRLAVIVYTCIYDKQTTALSRRCEHRYRYTDANFLGEALLYFRHRTSAICVVTDVSDEDRSAGIAQPIKCRLPHQPADWLSNTPTPIFVTDVSDDTDGTGAVTRA